MASFSQQFRSLLAHHGIALPAEEVERMADDVAFILFLEMCAATSPRLTHDEHEALRDAFCQVDPDNAICILQRKYSREEWDRLLAQQTRKLLKHYAKTTLRRTPAHAA